MDFVIKLIKILKSDNSEGVQKINKQKIIKMKKETNF